MTGRIRSIKPELLEDEKTSTLSDSEFRIFVSAILMADDYGNFRGSWSFVAGQAFHSAPDEPGREAGFERLIAIGLLDRYRVRGQVYLHIHGWERHQRVDKPGKARCPGPSEADQCNPRSRDSRETLATDLRSGSPNPTSESDPERDLRAHTDRPPVAPEPTTLDVPQRSPEPSAPPSPRREPTDAPWGQPGDFGAKVAGETPTLRVVEPEMVPEERLSPWDPRAPEPAPRGDGRQVLSDDAFGADEVIGVYNAHRPPGLPACEPDEEDRAQLVRDIVGVIREARKADKSARAAGRPPSLGLHTVEGWIAFCERMHQAPPLLNFSPLPTLAKWVAGQGGARMRAALKRGDYDGERATSAPRETAMERNVREAFERARGADDRADNEPAWAAMLTAGSGAAAVKRR